VLDEYRKHAGCRDGLEGRCKVCVLGYHREYKKKLYASFPAVTCLTKTCSECGKSKPLDEFGKNVSKPDGRVGECKLCRRTYFENRCSKFKSVEGLTKICTWCKKEKPPAEFGKRLASPDGLNCWCKECTCARATESRAKPREKWAETRTVKKCSRCGGMKPLAEFSKRRGHLDGLNYYCKVCDKTIREERRAYHRENTALNVPLTKVCSHCKKEKTAAEFSEKSELPDGLNCNCKQCVQIYAKEWYASPMGKKSHRYSMVKRKYGLSAEQYDTLMQTKACMVCERNFSKTIKPHIDHDHVTGRVRGLICASCNIVLGNARDSLDTLRNAIDYLVSRSAEDFSVQELCCPASSTKTHVTELRARRNR